MGRQAGFGGVAETTLPSLSIALSRTPFLISVYQQCRRATGPPPGPSRFGEVVQEAEAAHAEQDEEETIRKAVDFSTTTRRQTVDWSGLPCEARFWDWKLGPAKARYL